jgi:hypothetical protein
MTTFVSKTKISRRSIKEERLKIMQIKQSTYERLRNHSIYYCDNLAYTYDDIITKLLDFYEERYDYNSQS